jgi:putative SOS response-associated peptidase YedK
MCGRYDSLIARHALTELFGVNRLPESNFPPRYNIAPTQDIPIVRRAKDGERELVVARWGLIPFWMKEKPKQPHINARAETVHKTPLFREAFEKRRCLIPATGFYEWEKRANGRQPYRFRRRDLEPFAFAGLWEFNRNLGDAIVSATIIVTGANALVGAIHERMPVILFPEDHAAWLDPATPPDAARALLRPFPPALMEAYPVSRLVNSHENDGPELIEPIAVEDDPFGKG